LVGKGVELDRLDGVGETPIQEAARQRHERIVRYLRERGASVTDSAFSGTITGSSPPQTFNERERARLREKQGKCTDKLDKVDPFEASTPKPPPEKPTVTCIHAKQNEGLQAANLGVNIATALLSI
jgi:hypothetical protein